VAQRDERVLVMLSPDERQAVEVFRFHNRIPTMSEAIRLLLRKGIDADLRSVPTIEQPVVRR
jgi:hypothetical protein